MIRLLVPGALPRGTTAGLGLAAAILLAGCGGADRKQAAAPAAPGAPGAATEAAPAFNPLSIEAVREREYVPSTIIVERKLSDEGSFRTDVVSYESDGLVVFALMKTPSGPAPRGGFPVLIVSHGAQNAQGYSTLEYMGGTTDYFASRGFLVLKPDYRGYGESSNRGGGWARVGYYAVDLLSLIAAVPTIRGADPRNVFVLGQGMGGDVALRALEATGAVRAASLWAPVAAPMPLGLVYYSRSRREAVESRIRSLYGADLPRLSTVDNLAFLAAPLAIHHGTEDSLVPHEWSADLAALLEQAGRPHRFYSYEGGDHDLGSGYALALARDELFFREHMDRTPR
jgi:dipeptidyl aminopeptidase/acylaminoacyl peptidase